MNHSTLFFATGFFVLFVCSPFPSFAAERPGVREVLQELEKQEKNHVFDRNSMYVSSPRVVGIKRHVEQSVKADRRDEAAEFLTELFRIMRELDEEKEASAKKSMIQGIGKLRHACGLYDNSLCMSSGEIALYRKGLDALSFMQDPVYQEFCLNRRDQLREEALQIPNYEDRVLTEAARAAYRLEDPVALAVVAGTFAQIGDPKAAEELFGKCFDLFESAYKGGKSRNDISEMSYLIATEILEPKLDISLFRESLELVQKYKSDGSSSTRFNSLAEKCTASGTEEEIRVILPFIVDPTMKKSLENILKYGVARGRTDYVFAPPKPIEPRPKPKPVGKVRIFRNPPEIPFDDYAEEFCELENWRQVFTLLLKKTPTPEDARNAISTEPIEENLLQKRDTGLDVVLEKLGQEFVKRGEFADAIAIADKIKHPSPKAGLLLAAAVRMDDLAKTPREKEAAEKVFAQLGKHQESYGNENPGEGKNMKYFRDERYCAMVIRFLQRNRMDETVAISQKIETPFQKAEALYAIAMKYALLKQYEQAIETALEIEDASSGGFTHWTGSIGCGIGPGYSKIDTLARIIELANQSPDPENFDVLKFVDLIENPRKRVDALLSYLMSTYDAGSAAPSSKIGGLVLKDDLKSKEREGIEKELPLLSESEQGRKLLERIFRESRAIPDAAIKEKTMIQVLPLLQNAKMSQEVFQAASLIDHEPKYQDPQGNPVEPAAYNLITTSLNIAKSQIVLKAAEFLARENHPGESMELCNKVLVVAKNIVDGRPDPYPEYPNYPHDSRGIAEKRNQLLCEVARIQKRAGYFQEAKRTLDEELEMIQNLRNQTPFLNRIAKTQQQIGDREAAEKSYLKSLGNIENSKTSGFYLDYERITEFRRFCENYARDHRSSTAPL